MQMINPVWFNNYMNIKEYLSYLRKKKDLWLQYLLLVYLLSLLLKSRKHLFLKF